MGLIQLYLKDNNADSIKLEEIMQTFDASAYERDLKEVIEFNKTSKENHQTSSLNRFKEITKHSSMQARILREVSSALSYNYNKNNLENLIKIGDMMLDLHPGIACLAYGVAYKLSKGKTPTGRSIKPFLVEIGRYDSYAQHIIAENRGISSEAVDRLLVFHRPV